MGIGRKLVWAAALLAEAHSQEDAALTILLHETAPVPTGVLSRAQDEVRRIFSLMNIRIAWIHCSGVGAEPGVPSPCPARPAGTVILRIVPETLDFLDPAALGYALLPERGGLYATVSFPRVERCTTSQSKSAAELHQVFGHAMAHELGHILLGTGSHGKAGLMQPGWDAAALDDISKGRLLFSPKEAVRIRAAVVRRASK